MRRRRRRSGRAPKVRTPHKDVGNYTFCATYMRPSIRPSILPSTHPSMHACCAMPAMPCHYTRPYHHTIPYQKAGRQTDKRTDQTGRRTGRQIDIQIANDSSRAELRTWCFWKSSTCVNRQALDRWQPQVAAMTSAKMGVRNAQRQGWLEEELPSSWGAKQGSCLRTAAPNTERERNFEAPGLIAGKAGTTVEETVLWAGQSRAKAKANSHTSVDRTASS